MDAGDVFSGTLYFTQWQGQADLEFMNLLGYDAMGLGNHEFDQGPETLAEFVYAAEFPIVNANFDFSGDGDLGSYLSRRTPSRYWGPSAMPSLAGLLFLMRLDL